MLITSNGEDYARFRSDKVSHFSVESRLNRKPVDKDHLIAHLNPKG